MWKPALLLLAALCAGGGARAAELTDIERRWLQGAWPVVAYAKQQQLPLDIVVQPQPAPGLAPLALAFVDGRCKLVLSMRGNPEAEATLSRIAGELQGAALELMAAHELGHCRRHLDDQWQRLPPGFSFAVPPRVPEQLRAAWSQMKATRREEGYADLVALAWARSRHPQAYARLHAWLVDERSRDLIEGSHHDTLAWLRLAAPSQGARQALPLKTSPFDGVQPLWAAGLDAPEAAAAQ